MFPVERHQSAGQAGFVDPRRTGRLYSTLFLYLTIIAVLAAANAVASPGRWWFAWPALALGLVFLMRAWSTLITPRFIGGRRPERRGS